MEKINKKGKEEKMNIKKTSKKLLIWAIAILIVLVIGIIYTFASSSSDVAAPITSISSVTGINEEEPFSEWYKDQAVITLSAVDSDNGGSGGVETIDKAPGESDLSMVTNPPVVVPPGFWSDDFNSNLDKWNFWGSQSMVYNNQNSTLNLSDSEAFTLVAETKDVFSPQENISLEVDLMLPSVYDGNIIYGLKIIDSNDNSKGVMARFNLVEPDIHFGHTGTVGFGLNPTNQTSEGHRYVDVNMGQPNRFKLEYDKLSQALRVSVNGVVIAENIGSYSNGFITEEFPDIGSFTLAISSLAFNSTTSYDNFSTNIATPGSTTDATYVLGKTGMSLGETIYMTPTPELGLPDGVGLWGDFPQALPVLIDKPIDFDLYVYLTSINVPAGVFGNPAPLDLKWTLYSGSPQTHFNQVVAMLNQMGLATTVDAFAKVFDYVGNYTYTPTTLPISSEGKLVYNFSTEQVDLLPPGGQGPVISGVDNTYYRIGDTGSFSVYSVPFVVDVAGVSSIYYYSADKAGNMEFVKSIEVKVDRDTDNDGLYNNYDGCPDASGSIANSGCPYIVDIDSTLHVNYIGTPKFTKKLPVAVGDIGDPMNESIIKVDAKLYKLSDLGRPYGEIQKSCGTFYDGSVNPIATRSMPSGSEVIGLSSKNDYVVMQRVSIYEPTTNITNILTTCRNVDDNDFDSNGIAKKQMPIMKTVKNGIATLSGGQSTVMTGSMLEIVYPENIAWEEGVQDYVYTYIFTSDSDWDVDICTYTPEGYKVAGVYDTDGVLVGTDECTQTFVENQTKVVAFEVTDIGSPKEFDVELDITGKKKGEKKEQKINTKMHTKITSKKDMDIFIGQIETGKLLKTKLPTSILEKIEINNAKNIKTTKNIKSRDIGLRIKKLIKSIF